MAFGQIKGTSLLVPVDVYLGEFTGDIVVCIQNPSSDEMEVLKDVEHLSYSNRRAEISDTGVSFNTEVFSASRYILDSPDSVDLHDLMVNLLIVVKGKLKTLSGRDVKFNQAFLTKIAELRRELSLVSTRDPLLASSSPYESGETFEPMEHQNEGVAFFREAQGRCIFAWEPGTGKTFGTCLILNNFAIGRTVVMCPEYLRLVWKQHIERHTNRAAYILGFDKSATTDWPKSNRGVLIVGYASTQKLVGKIGSEIKYDFLVSDECQFIKNLDAQRTKAAWVMSQRVPYMLGLSGTPYTTRPIEFYAILHMIAPNVFTNKHDFGKRYCDARRNNFGGWDYDGASNLIELHNKLLNLNVMMRVKKSDVADLPKRRALVPLEIDNPQEYVSAERDLFAKWLDIAGNERFVGPSAMEKITALRQIASKGKMSQALQWMDGFLSSGQKLVIFGYYKQSVEFFTNELNKLGYKGLHVHGDVSHHDRQLIVNDFNDPKGTLQFVCATQGSLGTGQTLTGATNMAIFEGDWPPGVLLQIEDRINRIGQLGEAMIWYLAAAGTIDEVVMGNAIANLDNLNQGLDGVSIPAESFFDDIVNTFSVRAFQYQKRGKIFDRHSSPETTEAMVV